jgi:hypothetical protein
MLIHTTHPRAETRSARTPSQNALPHASTCMRITTALEFYSVARLNWWPWRIQDTTCWWTSLTSSEKNVGGNQKQAHVNVD